MQPHRARTALISTVLGTSVLLSASTVVPMRAFGAGAAVAPETDADPADGVPANLVTLGAIDGENAGANTVINIRLDHKPAWTGIAAVQDHGAFLQLILPGTLVTEPGKFYEGVKPYLPKIAAVQLTPSDAAVRIFSTVEASLVKQAATIGVLGNRIIVTVDHKALQAAMAAKKMASKTAAVPTPVLKPLAPMAVSAMPAIEKPAAMAATAAAAKAAKLKAASEAADVDAANASLDAAAEAAATDGAKMPAPAVVAVKPAVTANSVANSATAKAEAVVANGGVPVKTKAGATAAASVEPPVPATTADKDHEEITAAGDDAAAAADALVATTEVRTDTPAPAALLKGDANAPKLATGGLDLREKLVKVALFVGVLLALMLLSWTVRPMLRRRTAQKTGESQVEIKTIATHALAARQKIQLVQIGNERILLGITPDNVTFLTMLSHHEGPRQRREPTMAQTSFTRMLENAESDAPMVDLRPSATSLPPAAPQRPAQRTPSPEGRPIAQPVKASTLDTRAPRETRTARETPEIESRDDGEDARAAKPRARSVRGVGERINVAIGDDGVRNVAPRRNRSASTTAVADAAPAAGDGENQRAIDDVTKLIREKLKNLRSL